MKVYACLLALFFAIAFASSHSNNDHENPFDATDSCELCKSLFTTVSQAWKDNVDKQQLKKIVKGECKEIPQEDTKHKCINVGKDLVDQIYNGLNHNLKETPQQFCTQALSLCSTPTESHKEHHHNSDSSKKEHHHKGKDSSFEVQPPYNLMVYFAFLGVILLITLVFLVKACCRSRNVSSPQYIALQPQDASNPMFTPVIIDRV